MKTGTLISENFSLKMLVKWWRSYIKPCLTHCSLETLKRVIGKQCRPRSNTTECGIWSGSPLFANSSTIFSLWISKSQPDIPQMEIRIFQYIVWGSSFSLQWVKPKPHTPFTSQISSGFTVESFKAVVFVAVPISLFILFISFDFVEELFCGVICN